MEDEYISDAMNYFKTNFKTTFLFFIIFSLIFSVTPILNNSANAGVFEINSVTETGKPAGRCAKIPSGSRFFTYDMALKNDSLQNYSVEWAAYHSPQPGCEPTNENLTGGFYKVFGKTFYGPSENGQLVLQYDTESHNCGRVQYDAVYRVPGVLGGNEIVGVVVDYGVACSAGFVSGYVYEDFDTTTCCNGVKNWGEPGISNRTVSLRSPDGSQVLATRVTDAEGFYSFTNLTLSQNYRVEHPVPSGFVRTTDDSFQFQATASSKHDFGLHRLPLGQVVSTPTPSAGALPAALKVKTGASGTLGLTVFLSSLLAYGLYKIKFLIH